MLASVLPLAYRKHPSLEEAKLVLPMEKASFLNLEELSRFLTEGGVEGSCSGLFHH